MAPKNSPEALGRFTHTLSASTRRAFSGAAVPSKRTGYADASQTVGPQSSLQQPPEPHVGVGAAVARPGIAQDQRGLHAGTRVGVSGSIASRSATVSGPYGLASGSAGSSPLPPA